MILTEKFYSSEKSYSKSFKVVLHVPNGDSNFKLTYLRAPMELANKIADLGFSEKSYFLYDFLFKTFHSEKSYRGLIFFVSELRCGPGL